MPTAVNAEFFGKPVRWYVDQAEWPFVTLSLVVTAAYIGSFWLEVSYLALMAPLVFMLQVAAGVAVAYLTGVRLSSTLVQTMAVCAFVAFGGGAVSALWAVLRFWYPWLVLNLVTEPVWSVFLAVFVSLATVGFFQLPRLVNRLRAVFQPEA